MDEKKITAMVLIDLSKAFDSISHDTLLYKLKCLGTSQQATNWFEDYLTNRQQATRIGSSLSDYLYITHGVPQGSILGPMLFGLYMNDLPSVIKHCRIESYVDDTKIYLSFAAKDVASCLAQVEEDLRHIAEWCCINRLLINPDKTKFIIFGVPQLLTRVTDVRVQFLGKTLLPEPFVKDLGIILDSNLSFNQHVTSLMSSLLGSLCRINRVRHLFNKDILLVILNSLVFSKLFYCSTIWAGTSKQNIDKLQLLQNFAARILTNVRKYDHISPALEQLGWLSIKNQLNLRDLCQIYKIQNSLSPQYLKCKLEKRSEVHKYNTRQKDHLNMPLCRTATAQRSFFHRAVNLWNKLSLSQQNQPSIYLFKRTIKNFYLDN
jgi:hypothetical protein